VERRWRVSTDDPAWIAHIDESFSAHEAEVEAAIALVSSKNLTRTGAAALTEGVRHTPPGLHRVSPILSFLAMKLRARVDTVN
jgi:hypothetical protein